ncbi:MAG: tetratricopeptide repeat protein [Longimicrobiales bacterium]|nr:tetratricopeptide repeat protein [Longimicrobiales bacterium]
MKRTRAMRVLLASLMVGLVVACAPRDTETGAVRRGDEAFAQGDYDEALAEYRLAIRQGADDPSVTARVAHTYVMMGRVDDAGAYYVDASARDPGLTDQAVSDLMRLARVAQDGNDRFAMATAVETALKLRPGVGVGGMSLPLARHYYRNGEYGRALPFYQKALADAVDESQPEVVFEVGVAHDEIGDCENALLFFERFREMVRPWERGEVDWYIGTCAFNLARGLLDRSASEDPVEAEADLQLALELVNRTVEVGEPRNIQAQAWFEKGEILAELGQCQEAMDAYSQVRFADQAGGLIDRAQDRFDEIRFGRGLEHLRDGRCR